MVKIVQKKGLITKNVQLLTKYVKNTALYLPPFVEIRTASRQERGNGHPLSRGNVTKMRGTDKIDRESRVSDSCEGEVKLHQFLAKEDMEEGTYAEKGSKRECIFAVKPFYCHK